MLVTDSPRLEQAGIVRSVSDLTLLAASVRKFNIDRDWDKFHDPKSLLLALVGEVGELAELLQWVPAGEARAQALEEPLHSRLGEEIADVLIYLVQLADVRGVELASAASAKLAAAEKKYPLAISSVGHPSRVSSRPPM